MRNVIAGILAAIFACILAPGMAAGADGLPDKPARGVVLVASESLRDPRFAHAVVLLTDFGREGGAGVILNRPTAVRVVDAIPAFEQRLRDATKIVYYGGPVDAGVARVLVRTDEPLPGGTLVLDGVYALDSMSALLRFFDDEAFEGRTRFYGGYAGWGPGQLETEIRRGDWILARAGADEVFSTRVETLWDELKAGFSGLWVDNFPGRRLPGTPFTSILWEPRAGCECESRHESHCTRRRPDRQTL